MPLKKQPAQAISVEKLPWLESNPKTSICSTCGNGRLFPLKVLPEQGIRIWWCAAASCEQRYREPIKTIKADSNKRRQTRRKEKLPSEVHETDVPYSPGNFLPPYPLTPSSAAVSVDLRRDPAGKDQPYKKLGKTYLLALDVQLKTDRTFEAPGWFPTKRTTSALLCHYFGLNGKSSQALLRSALGRWLTVLFGLLDDEHLPIALAIDGLLLGKTSLDGKTYNLESEKRIRAIFDILASAEEQLQKRNSSLNELVIYDYLTPWLHEMVYADNYANEFISHWDASLAQRIRGKAYGIRNTLKKSWETKLAEEAREFDQTGMISHNSESTFGRWSDIVALVDTFICGIDELTKTRFPSRLKEREHQLQRRMLQAGGPRLWKNPTVWVDVVGFAAKVLEKRGMSLKDAYDLLKPVLPILFPMAQGHFPKTAKTFYDQTARW